MFIIPIIFQQSYGEGSILTPSLQEGTLRHEEHKKYCEQQSRDSNPSTLAPKLTLLTTGLGEKSEVEWCSEGGKADGIQVARVGALGQRRVSLKQKRSQANW